MGLWGNKRVKSHISETIFDNVFDIRGNHTPIIQNMKKIYLLGFSIQRLWEKSLEIPRNFFIGTLFSKYHWIGAYESGPTPLFNFGLKYIFPPPLPSPLLPTAPVAPPSVIPAPHGPCSHSSRHPCSPWPL